MRSEQSFQYSVAPMMKWTDRHCRAFHRTLTRRTLLYTEMRTADAVIHGDREKVLGFSHIEHPIALQIGGSTVQTLARAARIGADWGYDQINLNCGCPSERVRHGAFGAALMADPEHTARCVDTMVAAVPIPVTVKCRIGLDTHPDCLDSFVDAVADAGCRTVIVHARLALTGRVSPRDNRRIPPLKPERVADLKRRRPDVTIVHNGGVGSLDQACDILGGVDGVMIGRAAYRTPAVLGRIDAFLSSGAEQSVTPLAAARSHRSYIERSLYAGVPLRAMTRHMLGLFANCPGARRWRYLLGAGGPEHGNSGLALYDAALAEIAQLTQCRQQQVGRAVA